MARSFACARRAAVIVGVAWPHSSSTRAKCRWASGIEDAGRGGLVQLRPELGEERALLGARLHALDVAQAAVGLALQPLAGRQEGPGVGSFGHARVRLDQEGPAPFRLPLEVAAGLALGGELALQLGDARLGLRAQAVGIGVDWLLAADGAGEPARGAAGGQVELQGGGRGRSTWA